VVQSTETGIAYLVNTTVFVYNLASITGAADNNWNSVAISLANTDTNLPATGLADGTYKVYAVDASGNLSSASSNSVTVATTATPYWQLIARQVDSDNFTDVTDELFWDNVSITYLQNENDNSSSKFMSIGNLNPSNYVTDGKYKFRLEWDGLEVDNLTIKEVIWTQTSWLTDSTYDDSGFQEIGVSGFSSTGLGDGHRFVGLWKSTHAKCVFDGDGGGHPNWWNCVGAIGIHPQGVEEGIPGPLQKIASSMHLYVWVP
jgi:hypothetical protein